MRRCKKCGIVNELNDATHHIVPKRLGGTDKDGRDVLCNLHHDDFHKRHYGIMMGLLIELGHAKEAIDRTVKYYKWWLKSK